MAQIEIIIRDDNGNIINEQKKFHYNLDLKKELFTDIEGAVEEFKIRINKELTQFFLEHTQSKFVGKKKL
jgi:hypothetical protein